MIDPKQFRATADDLLQAARSMGAFPYLPVVVNPGATADPAVALAVLAVLIGMAGERTDAGLRFWLHIGEECIVPGLAEGGLTADEAVAMGDALFLARPCMSLREYHDRAVDQMDGRDVIMGALSAVSVGVQLLAFIEGLHPGVLDDIERAIQPTDSKEE